MISLSALLVGIALVLVQALAAVPWVFIVFAPRDLAVHGLWRYLRNPFATPEGRLLLLCVGGGILASALILPAVFFTLVRDKDTIENWGRLYGAVLQLQLTIDFFIVIFPLLLLVWPKGSAVAQAAFREGVRQPMFWLLLGLAVTALFVWTFLPYFTFGEDYLMVKELGYDTIMGFAVVFGVLAASMFVSEEIEGRTAVTLMSKPVSRRQFLLGKYLGILLVALLMFGLLGEHFEGTLLLKRYLERMDPITLPEWIGALVTGNGLPDVTNDFLRGVGIWTTHTLDTLPGLVLSFSQVMVLVSISVAIATRVPMLVNLVVVAVIFLFGNLAPILVAFGRKAQQSDPGSVVAQMLSFIAQVFDTLLPGLDFFKVEPALVSDVPPAPGPYVLYLLSVTFYGLLYTLLVILFGLVLFEDRDVA
jgi:hypothetical protein